MGKRGRAARKNLNEGKKNGALAGIRTLDPMIKSHLLYRLSYERTKNGASDRNRTGDNHVGNVMLYQLSYTRIADGDPI